MRIASVATALPPHRYEQDVLIEAFQRLWGARHHNTERVATLHRAVCVGGRNLALPMEAYSELRGFGDANAAFADVATDLGARVVAEALDRAGLRAVDVDLLCFVTVTGVATPSIDARLVNRLGMRTDVKRLPIFGLGCVAGAAGLARLHDYLRAWPDHVAMLLSVELCSLTLQREDLSVANLIASGLFGDGAAAVVCVGGAAAGPQASAPKSTRPLPAVGPEVVATRSRFYPDTEDAMGWDTRGGGFGVVLSPEVPALVGRNVRADVEAFLADHGLTRADIRRWVCHPGGPRILEAFQQALELDESDLEVTWRSLREVGNLSSASVLFVLHDSLAGTPGEYGLLMAMGPGFCAELVLLRW